MKLKNTISHVVTVLSISGAIYACGKTRHQNDEYEAYRSNYVEDMQVGGAYEVADVMREAIACRRTYEFQGTKWFLYDGRYLFKTHVTGWRTYRLEK